MSPPMFRRFPILLLCALLACASVPLRAQAEDWEVRVTPFNQVFPALELSQARPLHAQHAGASDENALGNGSGLIALHLRARHDHERVHVSIAAPDWLSAPTHLEATLPRAGEDYELQPALNWDIA